MVIAVEAVGGVLVVLSLLFATVALWVGLVAGLLGERVAKCTQCGRFTMTVDGELHAGSCPESAWGHLERLLCAAFENVHLRHH